MWKSVKNDKGIAAGFQLLTNVTGNSIPSVSDFNPI